MSYLRQVVLQGTNNIGTAVNVPATAEGHLEVAIHDPLLPFGSLHTESMVPIFQTDAVYGVNSTMCRTTVSGTGGATASDSSFVVSTGTTALSFGTLQSRKRLRYRPGQGVIMRFTALFTAGVASSIQVAGLGHAEDGVYFGYNGTSFGVLYSNRGKREIQTLTITTKSSTAENAVVTLNGVTFNVPVTNGTNTTQTAYEISQGTYTGWTAQQVGATVVFVSNDVGNKAGTFSISGATVVGSFAETLAGSAATESWTPQASWNGNDKLNGSGASGITLDPTKYNVYQMDVQYLGAGVIKFKVLVVSSNGNNAEWVTVHTLRLPNTLTASSFGNPSFPFTMAAYSAGSTTNVSVKCASFSGFIEGVKKLHGPRQTYEATSTAVDAANYRCLFTIRNSNVFGGRTNQSVINIMSITASLKHTNPCGIYVIKNATLAGVPSFANHATDSCSQVDYAATTCTFSDNSQLIWADSMGETGNIDHHFNGGIEEVTLQPGETLTVAAKSTTGTPSQVKASLNTREDQ